MAKQDYVKTLKTGLDFVGKMAAKSYTSISKSIKSDEKDEMETRTTGLYFQRHLMPNFGSLNPQLEYFESIYSNRLTAGFVKKLIRSSSDRSFVNACFGLIFGNTETALENLAEAIAAEPQFADAYFLQGAIFMAQKKFLRAEESLSKCRLLPTGLGAKIRKFIPSLRLSLCISPSITFTFFPDILGLNLLLAVSQHNGSKQAQAIGTLEQISSVMPACPELQLFLSAFYYEANWDDKISELLKDLIPADNMQLLMIQFLVHSLIERNSLTLAEGILQKAAEAEGVDPYIYCDIQMLMGAAAKKSGRNAEGSAYEQKVRRIYPQYQSLLERMGISRLSSPLSKHDVPLMEMPPILPEAPYGSKTVLSLPETLPETLPGGIAGAEPGQIRLKSRDNRVDVVLTDSIVIGREQGDIQLRWDTSASRTHARVFMEKGQIWAEDLNSTNGTWLNQHKLTGKLAFNRGDTLLVGKTEFYLE